MAKSSRTITDRFHDQFDLTPVFNMNHYERILKKHIGSNHKDNSDYSIRPLIISFAIQFAYANKISLNFEIFRTGSFRVLMGYDIFVSRITQN